MINDNEAENKSKSSRYDVNRPRRRHGHRYTLFYITNTIMLSNARLKLAKNQANANRHPEAELSLFANYSHSSSMLSSKNNRVYSKK